MDKIQKIEKLQDYKELDDIYWTANREFERDGEVVEKGYTLKVFHYDLINVTVAGHIVLTLSEFLDYFDIAENVNDFALESSKAIDKFIEKTPYLDYMLDDLIKNMEAEVLDLVNDINYKLYTK